MYCMKTVPRKNKTKQGCTSCEPKTIWPTAMVGASSLSFWLFIPLLPRETNNYKKN